MIVAWSAKDNIPTGFAKEVIVSRIAKDNISTAATEHNVYSDLTANKVIAFIAPDIVSFVCTFITVIGGTISREWITETKNDVAFLTAKDVVSTTCSVQDVESPITFDDIVSSTTVDIIVSGTTEDFIRTIVSTDDIDASRADNVA